MYFKCPPDGAISSFKDTAPVGSGGLVGLQCSTVCDGYMKLNNYIKYVCTRLIYKSWPQSEVFAAKALLGLVWPVAFDASYELSNITGLFHWLTHWLFHYCATTLLHLLPSLISHCGSCSAEVTLSREHKQTWFECSFRIMLPYQLLADTEHRLLYWENRSDSFYTELALVTPIYVQLTPCLFHYSNNKSLQ